MNSPYDFTNGSGCSTNSLSYSEGLLDTDVFGRVATPLISQPMLGYSQTQAYMHAPQPPSQEVVRISERCKALEMQLLKVTTERDTLKTMLEQLSPNMNTLSTPAPKAPNPNLRFWNQAKYNEWTNTPAAIADTRSKVAFIEDEEGKAASEDTIKAIRRTIRACWAELVSKEMAPKSWGKASATAKQIVRSHTYHAFPIMRLGENDWKLDLLCSMDYPGWVRNKLDDKGNWANSETPMGRKRKPRAIKSEVIEKKPKLSDNGDQYAEIFPASSIVLPNFFSSLPTPPTPAGDQIPLKTSTVPMGDLELPPPTSPSSSTKTPELASLMECLDQVSPLLSTTTPPSTAQELAASVPPPVPTEDPTPAPSSSPSSLESPTNSPAATPNITTVTDSTGSNTMSMLTPALVVLSGKCTTQAIVDMAPGPEPSEMPVVIDPLAKLVKKSVTLKLPPIPPVPDTKKDEDIAGDTREVTSGKSAHGKRKANSSHKMRPTKAKTGYNLCALRWLAQVNEIQVGTSDEFRTYWNNLNEGQREAYQNEAKQLVKMDAWDNTVSKGTVY